MHVLVIDDDPAYREILSRMLRSTYAVRVAEGGNEGLASMAEARPAAVLLDLQMPELDGIAVLQRMQQEASLANVPVIVISVFDSTDWKVRAIEAGANDYMVKPVEKAELLARLSVQMRRSPSVSFSRPPAAPPAEKPPSSASSLKPDHLLDGRYLIKGLLGRGGVSTVYEAVQLQLGRPVAIKVLAPNTRAHHAKRLEREAQLVGLLSHSAICQVHDMGHLEDGTPYLVMERLRGQSLAKKIAQSGPLPFGDIMSIMDAVLSALNAAHLNNIIHRDIKPDNVFLSYDAAGEISAKVLDFGMAKVFWSSGDTDPGIAMGTPMYMAPEQVLNYRVTPSTDIYGAGFMLFEMVTGRRPFVCESLAEIAEAIIRGTWPDPRELRPDVPEFLAEVIEKARARAAADRYPTADAFRLALREGSANLARAISDKSGGRWWRKFV